jgi:hypothetical protein
MIRVYQHSERIPFAWELGILIGDGVFDDETIEAFFGPVRQGRGEFDDVFVQFPQKTEFPQLWKSLGVFDSTSEARRNGWNAPIPEGFTDERNGKWPFFIGSGHKKKRICILKMSQAHT